MNIARASLSGVPSASAGFLSSSCYRWRICGRAAVNQITNRLHSSLYIKLTRNHNFVVNSGTMMYQSKRFMMKEAIEFPRLTPQQVSSLIRLAEDSVDIDEGPIKYFDRNQVNSNSPIEDRRAEAFIKNANQYLFGVFDGHGGCACAQAVSERLYHYIALCLTSADVLDKVRNNKLNVFSELLSWYKHDHDYSHTELNTQLHKSLINLAEENFDFFDVESTISENLKTAFLRLDQDISKDALTNISQSSNTNYSAESLEVAFSGAVSCVALINDLDLYIANVGDCRAVLGVLQTEDSETEYYNAVELSKQHNAENKGDVRRLLQSHPNESFNVIQHNRLLGDLAPFRAFGDVRYKWSADNLVHASNYIRSEPKVAFVNIYSDIVPKHYHTPPYLIAEPEILKHHLTPRDKFLVLASDGLWDMLSPDKVVNLVGAHMQGKHVLSHFHPKDARMSLKDMNRMLERRKTGLKNIPIDENAATHLIRHALGGDHGHVSSMLSLPGDVVRYYRDDITVLVIYFNTDYIVNSFSLH